ncbi:hypothetical protein Dimus_037166, partial [Dionaea muscipula]
TVCHTEAARSSPDPRAESARCLVICARRRRPSCGIAASARGGPSSARRLLSFICQRTRRTCTLAGFISWRLPPPSSPCRAACSPLSGERKAITALLVAHGASREKEGRP